MRKLLLLTVAASLAVPTLAQGAWEHSRRTPRKRLRPPPALVERTDRRAFAPSHDRTSAARSGPRVSHGQPTLTLAVGPAPFWLGRSWGWGYYPLWPRPYDPGSEAGDPTEETDRLSARLEAYGAGANDQGAGTLALSLEGRGGGLNASVTSFTVPGVDPVTRASSNLTTGSVAATWSFVSEAAFRLRLELGASMLSVPTEGSWNGASFANTVAFGPQVGVSGHVGLAGPFGFEGHARVTPFPVPVVDTKAAFVVRGGAVAVSAGWHVIDVKGDGLDAPQARFAGPELGLQLGF
jgi:hypothetical protein